MGNPFIELENEGQDPNPFLELEQQAPSVSNIRAPVDMATGVPNVGPGFLQKRSVGDTSVRELTLDDFINPDKLLPGASPQEISARSIPISGPIARTVEMGRAMAADPFSVAASFVTDPFRLAYGGLKEFATQAALPEEMKQAATKLMGTFTPEEAEEARRGFTAFMVSTLAGAAVGGLARRIVGKTAAAKTGITTELPALQKGVEDIAYESLPAGTKAFSVGAPAATAGAYSFGHMSAPDNERVETGMAYALLALPLAFLGSAFEKGGKIKGPDLVKGLRLNEKADFIHNAKQVRANDEQAPSLTKVEISEDLNVREVPREDLTVEESTIKGPVLYHGTNQSPFKFETYDRMKGPGARSNIPSIDQIGSWWTSSKENAKVWGSNVVEAQVVINNPLVVNSISELKAAWKASGAEGTGPNATFPKGTAGASDKFRDWLRSNGYDGIHFPDASIYDPGISKDVSYTVALDNNQVVNSRWTAERLGPEPVETPTIQSAAKLTQDVITNGSDITSTILKAIKTTDPKDVRIIAGVENPLEAIAKANTVIPDPLIAVHKRPDGLYDIAVGGSKSDLKGKVAQFQNDGFYEGQNVGHHGFPFIYLSRGTDKAEAWIRRVGEENRFRVNFKELQRLPYTPLEVPLEKGILKEAESLLNPQEYQAYKKLYEGLYKEKEGPVRELLDMDDLADANGYEIAFGHANDLQVRDKLTGELLQGGFYTEDAVKEWVVKSGMAKGGDAVPPEMDIAKIGGVITPPPARPTGLNEPMDYPSPKSKLGTWLRNISDAWSLTLPRTTPMADFYKAADNRHGYDIYKEGFHDVNEARKITNMYREKWIERMDKELAPLYNKLTPDEITKGGLWIEAMSADDIRREGLQKSRLLSQEELQLGEKLSKTVKDVSKIEQFAITRNSELIAAANSQNIRVSELPQQVRNQIINDLANDWKMTPEEMNAVKTYDYVRTQDLQDVAWYNVSRYAESIIQNSPDRATFAKMNNMKPEHIKLWRKVETMFEELAKEFDIEDYRQLRGYLHRVATEKMMDPTYILMDPLDRMKGMISKDRMFAADMIRHGLLNEYNRDPVVSLFRYIVAGHDNKYFLPTWQKGLKKLQSELAKGLQRGVNKSSTEVIQNVTMSYMNSIRGAPEYAVQATQQVVDGLVENLGLSVRPDVRKNFVNSALALTADATMGYRMGLGVRDAGQAISLYYTLFGNRAGSFMKYAVSPELTKYVKESGIISGFKAVQFATPDDMYASDLGKHLKGASRLLQKEAERGLTLSGQKNVYEMVLTGTYGEVRNTVLTEMSQFLEGKITKEKFYKNIDMGVYDPPDIKAFEQLVNEGKTIEAADFLGRVTARYITPIFGLSNHPFRWGTNTGRLFSQFGSWPAWARVAVMRMGANGSNAEIAARMARFGMTQAALSVTGNVMGMNLSKWFMIPGLAYGGSIPYQVMTNSFKSFGGNEYEREKARTRLLKILPTFLDPKRLASGDLGSIFYDPRSILFPGSYAFNDMLEIMRAANNGESVRAAGVAFGVPIMESRPWYEDFYEIADTPAAMARWMGVNIQVPRP